MLIRKNLSFSPLFHKNLKKNALLLSFFAVILFAAALVIIVRQGMPRSSFQLEQAVICMELDDQIRPLRINSQFPSGTRQVCLWFKYRDHTTKDEDDLSVKWFLKGALVYKEVVNIYEKSDVRAFYLLKEDGQPLPVGEYSVRIELNGKIISDLAFDIINNAK